MRSQLRDTEIDALEAEIFSTHNPDTTEAAQIQEIMDVKYAPADINEMVSKCDHLRNNERSIKTLLQKFEPLLDGTLGTSWDIAPIDLELKDPKAKPYHARPYPVPQPQEAKLKAEIERLVSYGVLQKVNRSEWALPMLRVTKKDQTLRSIPDLREVREVKKRIWHSQSQRSKNYYTNSKDFNM
jgi:hypothetical protein